MIEVIFGRRGSGKTTLVKERIDGLGRVMIFDPMREYDGVAERVDTLDDLLSFLDRRGDGVFRVTYTPDDPADDAPLFLRAAWVVGQLTVVIEELPMIASAVSIPPELGKLIRQGRHRGVSIIATSQRPADMPRLITSQAHRVVTFRQIEPRDVQYLSDYMGSETALQAPRLPEFRYLTHPPALDENIDLGADSGPLDPPDPDPETVSE